MFLLGSLNLVVPAALYCGKPHLRDGGFVSHALPALLGGAALLAAVSFLFMTMDRLISPSLSRFVAAKPRLSKALASLLVFCAFAGLIYTLREHLMTFFGTLSGVIMRERVVSYVPGPLDSIAGVLWAAVLLGIYLVFLVREMHFRVVTRPDLLKSALLMWPAVFFAIFTFVAPYTAERYYLIPHFLLLVALALVLDEISLSWSKVLATVLIVGFAQGQFFFWSEATRAQDRRPIEVRFGSYYNDKSAYFLRLDPLEDFLWKNGICEIKSSNYFISEPLKFLQEANPPVCRDERVAQIEYCAACRQPVPWFEIKYQ
ncbi:MAG: hypothetical protein JOZ30_18880 [Hyphomicrobiales bacterium]|nr:hypothetical protein [Hyphomicrobiales bacterium]